MRIEATNLQEAFQKAAEELNCSVTQLDIKILQNPSSGFLGFFKKNAIIEAVKEGEVAPREATEKKRESKKEEQKNHKDKKKNHKKQNEPKFSEAQPKEVKKEAPKNHKENGKNLLDNSIIDTFNKTENDAENEPAKQYVQKEQKPKIDIEKVLPQIKQGVDKLFGNSFFAINRIEVGKFDDETVLIELDGEDAALLIGKEGYRYKAISYMLYNWINSKFNLAVRLEIAQFLQNQEAAIEQYLKGIIERVEATGRAKTKPLDGVLVKIALEKLREKFPDKYVSIKSNRDGQFVVINDFLKK